MKSPQPGPTAGAGPVVLAAGGLAAAFAVASCCALPMILGAAGLGSAWLFRVAILAAPHRGVLLFAGAGALGAAAALLWRQRAGECVPGAVCTRPIVRRATVAGLIAAAALLVAGYVYR